MKRIGLFIFFACLFAVANAQTQVGNSITGTVLDAASKAPLEYGTVTIFKKGSKKPVNGTTTDKAGNFTLNDIPSGIYTIVFENIGYSAVTMNDVDLTKKDAIVNLKNILLNIKQGTLETVKIVSKAKLIENKLDKLVYNADKDITSQGGVATDLLKKIPQVSVDVDGNVQLAGNSGIKFLINGKPSAAFGSNITDVLQSIPSSQIKSIEVITNPGAKYDAQGLGGIINIILKSNNTRGYNANLSLTGGLQQENGSFNFNVRKENFGVSAFFSGNKRLPTQNTNNSYRVTTADNTTSTLQQLSQSNYTRGGFQTGAAFDWTHKKYDNFSGNFSYNHFESNGHGNTNQQLQEDINNGLPAIVTLINSGNKYTNKSIDASLNYKRTFVQEGQELEASISINPGNSYRHSYADQFLFPADTIFYGNKAFNPATTRESQFTLDYTQPFKHDVTLGVGGKISLYNINSNADVDSYQPSPKMYLSDSSLSNDLQYHQKVYATYAELSFPVGKIVDAKIGGRYERTEINAYFSNALQQTNIPGYNTFVPSVFLSRKIGENQSIRLSYSKRIERPDYHDLNPFINTSDPKNLSTGNPYLQPEIGNRYELGYSNDFGKLGSGMINFFYRVNNHDIQPYIVYYPTYQVGDSIYSNVSVSTRQNIGKENNVGLNLFGSFHFTPKLDVRTNAFLYWRHTINAIDIGLNANSFNYRLNINATYQFTNTLVAEFFGNFSSARNEAQGRYPSFTYYSMAIRKQFFKKKVSLALTATNPFNKYLKLKTVLQGSNFTVNSERKIPFRSIGLNFTWKFGKLEFKKKNDEQDNNLNGPSAL
jgi:outer membrane receptor protein involved in Fe transport